MQKSNRKICTVLVDRANYGRMWPVMKEIEASPSLTLQTICAGTMLLERFGHAERHVRADGFSIDGRVYLELEGSSPITMAKSIGLGIIEFTNEYLRLQPDVVLLIGDRYEALAAAIAAAYMNIPIAHIQGGERSGSIDESARHAITKFAHIHFPSTQRARDYLIRMGEADESVFNVGCPSGDYILRLEGTVPEELFMKSGVGASFKASTPFLLVLYHPVTTEFGMERHHVNELIAALDELAQPTVWLWPNIDAGSDDISKALRVYRECHNDSWLHLAKHIEPRHFQLCLKNTICAIGNSSSFVRDSSFTGTPVVLVGNRQQGREVSDNVLAVPPKREAIVNAIKFQVQAGRYPPSTLYGNGTASKQIVDRLERVQPSVQKHLAY